MLSTKSDIYLFNSKSSNLKKELASKIKNINKKNFNKNVLFSSVVPQVFNKIKFVFKKKKMKVYEIKNFNLKKLMKFNIKKYSQLGSDRIAIQLAHTLNLSQIVL